MTTATSTAEATIPLVIEQRPSFESVLRKVPAQERSKQRLQSLIAATADCVVERGGTHDLSLHDVAQRLDVPVSSVYQFFKDIDAALLAVILDDDKYFDAAMLERIAALEDPTAHTVVDAVWRGLAEAYQNRPAFVHITIRSRNRTAIARYAECRNAEIARALVDYARAVGLATDQLTVQRTYLAAEATDRVFQYAFHDNLNGNLDVVEMGAGMVAAYIRRFTTR